MAVPVITLNHDHNWYLVWVAGMEFLQPCLADQFLASATNCFDAHRCSNQRPVCWIGPKNFKHDQDENVLSTPSLWAQAFVPHSSREFMDASNAQKWDLTILLNLMTNSRCCQSLSKTVARGQSVLLQKAFRTTCVQCRHDRNPQAHPEGKLVITNVERTERLQRMLECLKALANLHQPGSQQTKRISNNMTALTEFIAKCSQNAIVLGTKEYSFVFQELITLTRDLLKDKHHRDLVLKTCEATKEAVESGNRQRTTDILHLILNSEHVFRKYYVEFVEHASTTAVRSADGSKARFYAFSNKTAPLEPKDIRIEYDFDENQWTWEDLQLAGIDKETLYLQERFSASPLRLIFSSDTVSRERRAFCDSLRYSFSLQGDGFAVPETHFDTCGVGECVGQGIGVTKQDGSIIFRRMERAVKATMKRIDRTWVDGVSQLDLGRIPDEDLFLDFLSATCLKGDEQPALRYGKDAASDDMVFRLLPSFLQFSSKSVQLLQQNRSSHGSKPVPTAEWSANEILRIICSADQLRKFAPIFLQVYGEEKMNQRYEVLAHPQLDIVYEETIKSWPIIAVRPQYMVFKGQKDPGLSSRLITLISDKTFSEDLRPDLQQSDNFEYFLHNCLPSDEFCDKTKYYLHINTSVHYAFVFPSRTVMDAMNDLCRSRGATLVEDEDGPLNGVKVFRFPGHSTTAAAVPSVSLSHFAPTEPSSVVADILIAFSYLDQSRSLPNFISLRLEDKNEKEEEENSDASSFDEEEQEEEEHGGSDEEDLDFERADEEDTKENSYKEEETNSAATVLPPGLPDGVKELSQGYGSVVFLFLHAVDTCSDEHINHINQLVCPKSIVHFRGVNGSTEPDATLKCKELKLPMLTAFQRSEEYLQFLDARRKDVSSWKSGLRQVGPYENPAPKLLFEDVGVAAMGWIENLRLNGGVVTASNFKISLFGGIDHRLLKTIFSPQHCAIVPFFLVTDNIHLDTASRTRMRSRRAGMVTATILQFVAALCSYGLQRAFPVPDRALRTAVVTAVLDAAEEIETIAEKLELRAQRNKQTTPAQRLRKESKDMREIQKQGRRSPKRRKTGN